MIIKSKKSEFDHFSNLAENWKLRNGRYKALYDIHPLRIEYINRIIKNKGIKNTKFLDLGCGGGLISQELAKHGGDVTGIDFVKKNLNLAKDNAKKNKLKINYVLKNFEKEKISSKFDVIIIFEVLEHLNDWKMFIKKIKSNLKKNGILIISTINRNLFSKILTIDIGENLLEWIPLNTHTYYKFIKPNELKHQLKELNFKNIVFDGLTYDIFKLNWKLSKNTKVNFFCSCNLS